MATWMREKQFDLVHVDSIDLVTYLPVLGTIPFALAHHNVESRLLFRRAAWEGSVRRAYMRYQARLIERVEREWCRRAAVNVVVSQEDASELEQTAPGVNVVVIPNGVDTTSFRPLNVGRSEGLVFVGTYSWFPNADGMEYFAREILPAVRLARPDIRVRWIGKIPEAEANRFQAMGIEAVGYVSDIRPVMAEAQCAIVPLRTGGGTRLKILDAWALGKAVVSTTVGAEGLNASDGQNILLADTPGDFASAILRVLADEDLRRRLETGGRETAVRNYDWDIVGADLIARYEEIA